MMQKRRLCQCFQRNNYEITHKELEQRFAQVGSQEDAENPIVIARYFNPAGGQTWYATEYNPDEGLFLAMYHYLMTITMSLATFL